MSLCHNPVEGLHKVFSFDRGGAVRESPISYSIPRIHPEVRGSEVYYRLFITSTCIDCS